MTFLAPGFLIAAAAVAALTIGIHFLVTTQPPSAPLPTARFIPAYSATVVATARRPQDLPLLLLRLALIALVGTAFARPHLASPRAPVVRMILADRSRAVADIGAVRDSVRRLLRTGDLLIPFDSLALAIQPAHASDSVATLSRSTERGALSAALILANREAASWRDRADSFEMDIVSPLAAEEADAGTWAVRALWKGRIHVSPVAAAHDSGAARSDIYMRATKDDPLRFAEPLRTASVSGSEEPATVRLVRDSATAADSTWVRDARGRTLVVWPGTTEAAPSARPEHVDTAGAVAVFRGAPTVVISNFVRGRRLSGLDGRPVARWIDGEPAAIERPRGDGCIRDVAILVPAAGDLVLRPEFGRLAAALLAPCGSPATISTTLTTTDIALLEGSGGLLPARRVAAAAEDAEPIVPWLLGAAIGLALIEVVARRGTMPQARDHV
jgi:aerotolerance regulator-like protein